MRREAGESSADAGGERGKSGGHPLDDQPEGGFRGPLVFGVVAATIQFAIILSLLYC